MYRRQRPDGTSGPESTAGESALGLGRPLMLCEQGPPRANCNQQDPEGTGPQLRTRPGTSTPSCGSRVPTLTWGRGQTCWVWSDRQTRAAAFRVTAGSRGVGGERGEGHHSVPAEKPDGSTVGVEPVRSAGQGPEHSGPALPEMPTASPGVRGGHWWLRSQTPTAPPLAGRGAEARGGDPRPHCLSSGPSPGDTWGCVGQGAGEAPPHDGWWQGVTLTLPLMSLTATCTKMEASSIPSRYTCL